MPGNPFRCERFRRLLILISLVSSLFSCASGSQSSPGLSPAALQALTKPAEPLQSAPIVAIGEATTIKTAEPAALSKAREERAMIEAEIVYGSPSSLSKAKQLLAAATMIRPDDARSLTALAAGIEALVYPSSPRPVIVSRVEDTPAASPAATDPASQAPSLLSGLERALLSVSAGRVPAMPPEAAGSALGEILPALIILASNSREGSRRAQEAIDRFQVLGASSILPDLLMGLDYERSQTWAGSLERYSRVIEKAPDAWPAGLGSARILLVLRRPAAALEILDPLAQIIPGSSALARPYGQALYENGRFAEATNFVTRVLTEDPQNSRFILIRAHLLVMSRSYQQVLPLLDAYGTVDSSNRQFLVLRCLVAEGLRNREEAIRWARRGLAGYPDDPELLTAAARLIFAGPSAGRDEARSFATKSYDLIQTSVAPSEVLTPAEFAARTMAGAEAAHLLMADAATRFEWNSAVNYLKMALSAPGFGDKAMAATIYRKSQNWQAALDYSSAWYRDEPQSAAAAEAYLRALVGSKNDRAAQDLIARLLPTSASPAFRSLLFFLQSQMQKSDDASLSLLRSALVEYTDNPEALAALFDIQMRRKDYAKAKFYLKQALVLAPGDPDLLRRQREIEAASP
jgi:tetratricopeptide (TPR) repeat protein